MLRFCLSLCFCLLHLPATTLAQSSTACTFVRYFGQTLANSLSNSSLIRNLTIAPTIGDVLTECQQICAGDEQCRAFIVDLRGLRCGVYRAAWTSEIHLYQNVITATDTILFLKSCYSGVTQNCSSAWHYNGFVGQTIADSRIYSSSHVISLENCQQMCDTQTRFRCRALAYDDIHHTCYLSEHSSRSTDGAVAAADDNLVYLESQCIPVPSSCVFFSANSTAAAFAVSRESAVAAEACEQRCVQVREFFCRSYIFDTATQLCRLSPDDRVSLAAVTTTAAQVAVDERAQCVDVAVFCDVDAMIINFKTEQFFNGRVYATDAPRCSFAINGSFDFNVTVSTRVDERSACAVAVNGSMLFVLMMLQFQPVLMTAQDRVFQLVCNLALREQTIKNTVELINSSIVATHPNLTKANRPISTEKVEQLPKVFMRIVNRAGQIVSTADVGQSLYAEVVLDEDNPADSNYSLFVTNCKAEDLGELIELVDDNGCPNNSNVFEGFYPVPGSDNRILRAAFQGFHFQKEKKININCNVNFCAKFCQPSSCSDGNGKRIVSFGKRKRRALELLEMHQQVNTVLHFHDAVYFVTNDPTADVIDSNLSYHKLNYQLTSITKVKTQKFPDVYVGLIVAAVVAAAAAVAAVRFRKYIQFYVKSQRQYFK